MSSTALPGALPRWFRRLANVALAYSVLVILFGATVRATGSGAGCGDHWPTCNGSVIPRAPGLQTQIEFTHRVTSGLALPLVLAVAIAAWRRPSTRAVRIAAAASVLLMLVEGAIGALLVKKQWVADDASLSRALAHAAHLVNTFLLLAAQTATCVFAAGVAGPRFRGHARRVGVLALLLVSVLALGASGAIAALGDTLFPSGSLAAGVASDFSASAHFLLRLRVIHPVLALFVLLGVGMVWRADSFGRLTTSTRKAFMVFAASYVAQILVGFVNLGLLAPIPLQIIHLLLADIVWVALVALTLMALDESEVRRGSEDARAPSIVR